MPAECLAYPARLFSHLDLTLGRGSQGSKIDYHPSKTERSLQAVVSGMPAWTQTDNKRTAPVAWVPSKRRRTRVHTHLFPRVPNECRMHAVCSSDRRAAAFSAAPTVSPQCVASCDRMQLSQSASLHCCLNADTVYHCATVRHSAITPATCLVGAIPTCLYRKETSMFLSTYAFYSVPVIKLMFITVQDTNGLSMQYSFSSQRDSDNPLVFLVLEGVRLFATVNTQRMMLGCAW